AAHGAPQRLGRRGVVTLDIVPHHARGQDLRPERLQRVAHHLHPPRWNAVLVAFVELRHYRVLQQVVERAGLQVVATAGLSHSIGRWYLPTVFAVIPLVPPAVTDRHVQPAVERTLHS